MLAKWLKRFILIQIVFFILPQFITSKTPRYISSSIWYNKEYIKRYRLQINPDNTSMDMILEIPKTYVLDPWLDLYLNLKNPGTNKSRRLLQYNINLCQIFGKGQGRLLTAWLNNFYKYGNLPKTCPMEEVSMYNNMNIFLDSKFFYTFYKG